MWLVDKVTQTIDDLCKESTDETDSFIATQYLHLPNLSGVYARLDRGHRLLTLAQLMIYISIMIFHYIILAKATLQLVDVSLVTCGETIHFCLLLQLVIVLVLYIQMKHNQIAMFHRSMAKNFFDYSETYEGIEKSLRKQIRKERRLLVMIPLSVGMSVGGVLVLAPQLDQYGTFDISKIPSIFNEQLPYPYAVYPYQTETGFGYYITVLLQFSAAIIVASIIGTGGLAYIIMSQNLWMQMGILNDSIENVEERAQILQIKLFGTKYNLSGDKLYNQKVFSYCYSISLKKNFKHHQIIMRNFQLWTDIFSIPVFLAYATGTLVIALCLLSLSSWVQLPGTTIASLLLCAGEVGYMYLFSLFSQRLTDMNEKLRFSIYCIKWYHCDEDVKKSVKIFQEVTLRPMTLVAGGLVPANMDTFSKVINSSYSYYNLVTAFNIAQ